MQHGDGSWRAAYSGTVDMTKINGGAQCHRGAKAAQLMAAAYRRSHQAAWRAHGAAAAAGNRNQCSGVANMAVANGLFNSAMAQRETGGE